MDIKELLKSEKSLNFIKYMRKVIGINYYSTAYSNLLGFTIHEGKLQFKNYYELREMPTDDLLKEFLPEIDSFKLVTQFWDEDVKFSLCFGQKMDEKNEIPYFHVKFGKRSQFVIQPKPAFIRLLKQRLPTTGLSYEYSKEKVAKKNYIYIEDKDDISKVLALSKWNGVNPNHLEHLECYYGNDKDFKINLIYTDPSFTVADFGKMDEETEKTYKSVIEFLSKHNKPIWYVGKTTTGKISLYFTCTNDKDFIENL